MEGNNAVISYNVGAVVTFGVYKWLVLSIVNKQGAEASYAFLIMEAVLPDKMPYNTERKPTTWEKCSLRAYLNEEFYNSFAKEDRAKIVETEVTNHKNPWFGTDGGGSTVERIFLLSLLEVNEYFGDSGQLTYGNPNSKLFINDEYKSKRTAKIDGKKVQWWLRSPGIRSEAAAGVFPGGAVHVSGHYVNNNLMYVRPALKILLR